MYVDRHDLAISISVSGESPNVFNAAHELSVRGIEAVSFTGKAEYNSLGQAAIMNLFADSHSYNIV